MAASLVPQGWDLRRIRDYSGDQTAEILDTDCVVTTEPSTQSAGSVRAVAVFGFRGLAVVQLAGDDAWHMGSLDRTTGAVDLWATYDDFGEALRGL